MTHPDGRVVRSAVTLASAPMVVGSVLVLRAWGFWVSRCSGLVFRILHCDFSPSSLYQEALVPVLHWISFWLITISWFVTIWLFFAPKLEQNSCWKTVREWCWRHFRCRRFFWGSGGELLCHRDPSTAAQMEEVCGPQTRLCWKIKLYVLFYYVLFSLPSFKKRWGTQVLTLTKWK